ncbi:MAG: hypothetical protein FWE17_02855 [Alphaproteobacteria bacterium]|nr:hypothetical protein [Alphaproteobacteria bacterium]MCL2757832.1 hypothetical protein [Alphaproteobacteria bacterium]
MNKLIGYIIILGVIALTLIAGWLASGLVAQHVRGIDDMFVQMVGIAVGIIGGYFVLPKVVK